MDQALKPFVISGSAGGSGDTGESGGESFFGESVEGPEGEPGEEVDPEQAALAAARRTATSVPAFSSLTVQGLEYLISIDQYETPLWGRLLGTGDETPLYPFIFGGVGVVALGVLAGLGIHRRRKRYMEDNYDD